jgi:hypothetical protein
MNEALQKLKKITKNSEESIKLLESALDKEDFLKYLLSYFDEEDILKEVNFSNFDKKLSENEFQQLPNEISEEFWGALESVEFSSIDATKPIKWLSITYQAIKNDLIHPYYLAFLDNSKNGKNNILEALRLAKQNETKKLFDVCRAILRHMFGHIKERGPKAVYQDIPFSIAWWRVYISKEAFAQTGLYREVVFDYLNQNPTNYNELVMRMSGKLTVVADKNIRNGLFLYVLNHSITKTSEFKKTIEKIGIESTWRAMGALSPDENKEIIESLVT